MGFRKLSPKLEPLVMPSRPGSPTLTSGVMEVALNRPKELNASGEPESQNEENHHSFVGFLQDWAKDGYIL